MMILETKGMSKSFGGVSAVSDFSMEVAENKIIGIIGPNGAGKTTIFNLISGVYKPDKGQIFLEGKDITSQKQEEIARLGIARTFQNIRLFKGLSVLDNVRGALDYRLNYNIFSGILHLPKAAKLERRARDKALELLTFLKLEQYADMRPENLPYGLQRRLEIARALALEPKILLLDEPAAGLNPEEIRELVSFIEQIKNMYDLSILVIEHRMDVIMSLCDKIYVQNFGVTIAQGTREEIQTNQEVLKAYLGGAK